MVAGSQVALTRLAGSIPSRLRECEGVVAFGSLGEGIGRWCVTMIRPGTTPACYVGLPSWRLTGPPTVADLYAGILADVLAGYQRIRGRDAAAVTLLLDDGALDATPQIASFQEAWSALGIAGRSVALPRNGQSAAVDDLCRMLEERGDLYVRHYDGWFCPACGRFYGDHEIQDGPSCRTHPQALTKVDTDCWIFRLTHYQERLAALYNSPETVADGLLVMPDRQLRELHRWVTGSLSDIPLCLASPASSDMSLAAGDAASACAPLFALASTRPGAENEVNYIVPSELAWHCAVVWPAILMATGRPPCGVVVYDAPPRNVPQTMIHDLGADAFRYLLLRRPAGATEREFGEALVGRYSAELSHGLANLVARAVAMAAQSGTACTVPRPEVLDPPFTLEISGIPREGSHPERILDCVDSLVRAGNAFIEERQPWKQASSCRARTLWYVLELCRIVAQLAAPVFPETAESLLGQLGVVERPHWPAWGGYQHAFRVHKTADPLFPAITAAHKSRLWSGWAEIAEKIRPTIRISPQEFARLDLRVARIASTEWIPTEHEALLKLLLDLGTEQRVVISATLAREFTPESLTGRTVAYLANLPPTEIAGFVSQGIILAAYDGKAISVVTLDQSPEPGTVMF